MKENTPQDVPEKTVCVARLLSSRDDPNACHWVVDPVLKGSNLGNVGVGSIDGILPGLVMAKEAGYEIHLYSTDECREKNSGLIEVSSEARKAIRAALNP